MPRGGLKYYAVRVGRKTGVFLSWPECERHTKGYQGAQFKSFSTKQDAEDWIVHGECPATEESCTGTELTVYTDGSHIKGTTMRGVGIHCLFEGQKYYWAKPFDDLPADASNPTLELRAATMVLQSVPVASRVRRITIVADYIGVKYYIDGTWKPKSSQTGAFGAEVRALVVAAACLRERSVEVGARHVNGHTGIPGNEAADQLSKERTERSNWDELWRRMARDSVPE